MVNLYSELVEGWRGSQQPCFYFFLYAKNKKKQQRVIVTLTKKKNGEPIDNDNFRD